MSKTTEETLSKLYDRAFQNGREFGIQEGRNQILEEWNHDQRKLLDGFNHTKDCEYCNRMHHE